MAEHLYQDSTSTEASSARSFESGIGRAQYEHLKLDDGRGDKRTALGSGQEGSMSLGPSGSSATYSSPYTPFSSWRPESYAPSVPPPASTTSTGNVAPGRRGTWRTEGSGNVLIFNTAGSSDSDTRPSATNEGREVDHLETLGAEEGEGESDAGDEVNKRYECLVPGCLKTFTTSGHARRHSRTHLGHKLFVCPHEGCRSTFTRRDNCRQHQRARHHMTLPVRESTETETLESLIVDRQALQQAPQPHYSYDAGSSSSSSQQSRRPPFH